MATDSWSSALAAEALGLQAGEYATVVAHDRDTNSLTVERASGDRVTYDPRRLVGVTAHQEQKRTLAVGDRVQFTAPSRELRVANRDSARCASSPPDTRVSPSMTAVRSRSS